MAIERLSDERYRALGAVNFSTLKEMRRSPRHYRHRLESPRGDTARLALGRATHTAILEPDRFALDYAVWKGERRAGKEWDAFRAANADKTIIKADEYASCLAMRDAVRVHPVARGYLERGLAEQAVTWTDETIAGTGLELKARVDWVGGALMDVKTTSDVDARAFAANAARMAYHGQLAFYLDGLRANGWDGPVKIVAVEADEPHDVAVFDLDAGTLAAGADLCADLLRSVSQCRTLGMWPGRYEIEQPLRLPAWATVAAEDATGIALALANQSWEG